MRIPSAAQRFDDFPHRLSGGMRQRVMIAMALSCKPQLLIADEPTTALDVTIQAQILALMGRLQKETGMSMLFVTHNLGVVAQYADAVAVMYAGRIVESARVHDLFARPEHPYTRGLLACLPGVARQRSRTHDGGLSERSGRRPLLAAIPGQVASPLAPPPGCAFAPRCGKADDLCRRERPAYEQKRTGHWAACWHSNG